MGGLPYIAGLMDAVPSAANLEYYLGIVREKHLLRRMLQACTGVITRVHDNEGEVDQLLDEHRHARDVGGAPVAVGPGARRVVARPHLAHRVVEALRPHAEHALVLTGRGCVATVLVAGAANLSPLAFAYSPRKCSTELMPTWSSTSLRLQPVSHGAGHTRPITLGNGLAAVRRRHAYSCQAMPAGGFSIPRTMFR